MSIFYRIFHISIMFHYFITMLLFIVLLQPLLLSFLFEYIFHRVQNVTVDLILVINPIIILPPNYRYSITYFEVSLFLGLFSGVYTSRSALFALLDVAQEAMIAGVPHYLDFAPEPLAVNPSSAKGFRRTIYCDYRA